MNRAAAKIHKSYREHVRMRLILFGILAGLLVLCAVFSEYLTPYDPYLQDLANAKAAPGALHILGTDRYGRDMLSRVIAGSKTSILSALLLVAVITTVGTAVGVLCGWCGSAVDAIFMRISDIFLAFPSLGIIKPCDLELILVFLFHGIIDLLRISDRVLAEYGDQAGSRILRIQIYLIADQGCMNNR